MLLFAVVLFDSMHSFVDIGTKVFLDLFFHPLRKPYMAVTLHDSRPYMTAGPT